MLPVMMARATGGVVFAGTYVESACDFTGVSWDRRSAVT
jgi:hypothetical protein